MNNLYASVGMVARAEWRFLMVPVAAEIKRRHGATIHMYCTTEPEAKYYREVDPGLFASVTVIPSILPSLTQAQFDPAEEAATARGYEERYGITYNLLSVGNRHIGRGFALAGPNHPRSTMSEYCGLGHVHYIYNRAFAFWEAEFEARGLTMLLNGGLEPWLVARRLGRPYRIAAGSRYRSYFYWAWTPQFDTPEFQYSYENDDFGELEPADIARPYDAHMDSRSKFMKDSSVFKLLYDIAYNTAYYIWWRLRGYEKGRSYFLGDNIRYLYRNWRDRSEIRRLARTTLKDLDGQRFVYFPLHIEPETALQMISPEYFFQHTSLAVLARDLPAGVRLAVKETFGALGRRPSEFYRHIKDLKPLVLLELLELGLDCVRKADVVATISGTGGFEGAVIGKPVISFGQHNVYNFLPHVRQVRSLDEVREALAWALSGDLDRDQAVRDGARFLAATRKRSFDLSGFSYLATPNADPEWAPRTVDGLDMSIAFEQEHGAWSPETRSFLPGKAVG